MTHPTRDRCPVFLIAVAITGCGSSGKSGEVTLTVYSASGLGAWYRSQFAKFTERTGVAVTLFEAGSGEVVSRVNSRAVWERLTARSPCRRPICW